MAGAGTGARRGRIALAAVVLGIGLIALALAAAYYREVAAPSRAWVVRMEGETVLTTGELARAIVVRELAAVSPGVERERGRAPYVLADERVELELMRMAAPAMGIDPAALVDAEVLARFGPPNAAVGEGGELDRVSRESYIRFLSERGVSQEEHRALLEPSVLRKRFADELGGVEALDEWLDSRRAEADAEVRLGSDEYAWVLEEARASLPAQGRE